MKSRDTIRQSRHLSGGKTRARPTLPSVEPALSPLRTLSPPAEPTRARHSAPPCRKPVLHETVSASVPAPIVGGDGGAGAAMLAATLPNMAYFSGQPPALPLFLVPVGRAGCCFEAHFNYPVLSQSVNVVRSMLRELITALPLPRLAPSQTSCTGKAHDARHAHKPTRVSRSASANRRHDSANSRMLSEKLLDEEHVNCNVATQAHQVQLSRGGLGLMQQWLGGVRALRDSHVRLMLRQLRHINRLNRAADRVLQPIVTADLEQ